jgi:hypothetical protein
MFTHLDLIAYGSAAIVLTGWIAILAWAGLKGWHGWLDYKRAELDLALRETRTGGAGTLNTATRIDRSQGAHPQVGGDCLGRRPVTRRALVRKSARA